MVLQTQFAQIRDRSLYIDDVNAMDLVKKIWNTTLCHE